MDETTSRQQFLVFAAVFEGGLILLGLALAWMVGVDPLSTLRWEWPAVAWGTAATVPMLILFFLSMRFPVGGLEPMKRFLVETIGPLISQCRWHDLIGMALLAGFCEEFLFRGVFQVWFVEKWGIVVGLLVSNLLFALAHFITPTYAVLAGAIGVYFGCLMHFATARENWLTPAVTHTLYDYVAFLVVIREYRRTAVTDADDDAQRECEV